MTCCVTLSNLRNFSGLTSITGVIIRAFPTFRLSGNSKAGKQRWGIEDAAPRQRGSCRLLFLPVPDLLPVLKQKLRWTEKERRRLRQIMDEISDCPSWLGPAPHWAH